MRRLSAKYLYTLTAAEPILNGFVEVEEDGTVVRTGVCPEGEAVPDGAIVPGFVNAHCHVELSYLKGQFRKGTGMAGFIDQINAMRDNTPQDARVAALKAAMDQLWAQGVVAMADISNGPDSFAVKAAHPLYTRTFLEVFGADPSSCADVMAGVKALQQKALAFGLDAAPTPHSCYTMSPKLLEITARRGLESGAISYHSQESQEEEDMIMKGSGALADNYRERGLSTPPVTGTTALEYFIDRIAEKEGKVKGRINLVHNVVISQRSIDRALEALESPFFSICPLSNIFIHRQLPPVDIMRKNGLKICLGTDSLSSNLILDMVREMECLQANFPHLELGEILSWACTNGAELLGKEDTLGSLKEGKTPGIVLLENVEGFRINENSMSTRLI